MPCHDLGLRPDLAGGIVGHVGKLHRATCRCDGGFDTGGGSLDAGCGFVLYLKDLVDRKRFLKKSLEF